MPHHLRHKLSKLFKIIMPHHGGRRVLLGGATILYTRRLSKTSQYVSECSKRVTTEVLDDADTYST